MNLNETECGEVREILAREIIHSVELMNRRNQRVSPNIERLRWERIEFLLAIRSKLSHE